MGRRVARPDGSSGYLFKRTRWPQNTRELLFPHECASRMPGFVLLHDDIVRAVCTPHCTDSLLFPLGFFQAPSPSALLMLASMQVGALLFCTFVELASFPSNPPPSHASACPHLPVQVMCLPAS